MFVFKAAVVGAGTMGGEIAHVIANAEIPVVLKDVEQQFVDQGVEKARSLWQARVDAGKLTEEEQQRKLGLISGTTSYELLGDVDFVIEAVPERIEVKRAVFGELDEVTPGHAILASNTSALSVTEMAQATGRPDKVVGFHFFYPASMMRLIEVIEGEDTAPETVQAAMNFAQAIRKLPIRCGEAPGFVVNRILNSSASELWRFQEESGIDVTALDRVVSESRAAPVGPFYLADLLGLDTVLHVAEHLRECYGESFYVHARMRELVAEGKLGAKTGEGFYLHGPEAGTGTGDGSRSTEADLDTAALVERFTLKALVEACLVLEEGVASMRDVDLGMIAGAGVMPPPFARADQVGLDEVLARLERAAEEWGERFAPPTILRRLVAQGRLGVKSGQGFFPYPRPDAGWDDRPVKLETRGSTAIAWLDRAPVNAIGADVMQDLRRLWDRISVDGSVRALVIASANPMLFSAGSDIKAFTTMDAAAGKDHVNTMHALLREMETSLLVTIAAVNATAVGGGCELAMACDVRIAAESATFGQPEINLGIIPGSGGTQRLPRLVGEGRALELNLTGDPIGADEAYALGLANRVVPDEELFDTALAWARKLSGQAPLAVEQIKQVSAAADIETGIEREKHGFARVFSSEDAREGISAFLQKRAPRFTGR